MDIYQQNGYKNRLDYLKTISLDYCIPEDVVFSLANMLGKNEDFDGLISALEDAEKLNW